jgi:radical SAM protein with 4Fe4S-binding SPASM domain
MKKSNYNFIIPYLNETSIIYNPLYGTIGKINKDNMTAYNNDTFSKEELEILYKHKVYIDDDVDELSIINKNRADGINDTKSKLFRIWTTTGCNARCFYCFEKGIKSINMNMETAAYVINYIISNLEDNDKLLIEWFGGEPLLNPDVIDMISIELINYCSKHNIKYRAYIITNGSLITESIVNKFKTYKIESCQITLDGYSEYYEHVKDYYFKNIYNFNSVINNIKLLTDNEINVSIRLNYSNDNYNTLIHLIEFLHSEFDNNRHLCVYVYPLWSSTDSMISDKYVSDVTLSEEYIDIVDKLVEYKFMSIKRVMGIRYKKNQCYARKVGTCSILPDGNITKCAETYNQIIGNIYDGITNKELYDEWTSTKLDPRCVYCKYLPLCNDGCKGSMFNEMDRCIPTKNITEELIKWYVSKVESKKSNK